MFSDLWYPASIKYCSICPGSIRGILRSSCRLTFPVIEILTLICLAGPLPIFFVFSDKSPSVEVLKVVIRDGKKCYCIGSFHLINCIPSFVKNLFGLYCIISRRTDQYGCNDD